MWDQSAQKKTSVVSFTEKRVQLSPEELSQIFNSALVSSQITETSSMETHQVVALERSAAFQEMILAMQKLADRENISHAQAAEKLILTFRVLDQFWHRSLVREGFEKLRKQLS